MGNRSGSLVRELAAEGRLREYPEKGIKKELPRAENPPEGTAPFAMRTEKRFMLQNFTVFKIILRKSAGNA